jgi:hypothetical protein
MTELKLLQHVKGSERRECFFDRNVQSLIGNFVGLLVELEVKGLV